MAYVNQCCSALLLLWDIVSEHSQHLSIRVSETLPTDLELREHALLVSSIIQRGTIFDSILMASDLLILFSIALVRSLVEGHVVSISVSRIISFFVVRVGEPFI